MLSAMLSTMLGAMHALHNPVHTVQHNKILCKNYAVKGAMFSAMPRAMLGATSMYLLTLFPNDPTSKFPIKNLLISIAIPTHPRARSDGSDLGERVHVRVGSTPSHYADKLTRERRDFQSDPQIERSLLMSD